MKIKFFLLVTTLLCSVILFAQIGTRFPSERKVVKDPVTGTVLTFLTSTSGGGGVLGLVE